MLIPVLILVGPGELGVSRYLLFGRNHPILDTGNVGDLIPICGEVQSVAWTPTIRATSDFWKFSMHILGAQTHSSIMLDGIFPVIRTPSWGFGNLDSDLSIFLASSIDFPMVTINVILFTQP